MTFDEYVRTNQNAVMKEMFEKLVDWIYNEDCEEEEDALNEAEAIFLDYFEVDKEEDLEEQYVQLFEKWLDYCEKRIEKVFVSNAYGKKYNTDSNDGIWQQSDYI